MPRLSVRLLVLLLGVGGGAVACSDQTGPGTTILSRGQVAVGFNHTCFLNVEGRMRCWGWGGLGQLGNGAILNSNTGDPTWRSPQAVLSDIPLIQVDAGANHTCALSVDGDAYCWGAKVYGELGNGESLGFQTEPVAVSGGLRFKELNVGDGHTCALTEAGEAYCWGLGVAGKLGNGGTADKSTPVAVSSTVRFTDISAGFNSTCGVANDGQIYCWGDNFWGQLGNGTVGSFSADPTPVSGTVRFRSVSVGAFVVCGVTQARDGYCWGSGSFGRLGTGENLNGVVPNPALVATGLKYESLEVGAQHTCGVTIDRAMYCWGLNTYGKLGDDIGPAGYEPILVSGGHTFVDVGAGSNHSCGLTTSNEVYCWGQNFLGQLGVPGQTKPTFRPLRVVL